MLLVTALATSKMFFTYIDRKQEKENHMYHLKPVCDSILSATPF